jgi:general secretion pathway protein K
MKTKRGASLIVALGVLAALLAVLAYAAEDQRIAIMAEQNRMEGRRAELAAEAGIQWSLEEMAEYVTTSSVTLADQWATDTWYGEQKFEVGNTSFKVQIVDAASFININTVQETQLENMGLNDTQVDSLLDWRSTGETPRANGAKDAYYNALPNPYNAKLGNFDSVDELLQVQGFNGAYLYNTPQENNVVVQNANGGESLPALADCCTVDSVSPNVSSSGTAKLNANTATAAQMIQRGIPAPVATSIVSRRSRGTFSTMGALLQSPGISISNCGTILDNLTVSSSTTISGLINVNTASAAVLETLPGMTTDIAGAIVEDQTDGITSMSDLASVSGMTLSVLEQCVDYLTIASNVFLVRSVGTAGQTSVALEAVVSITNGTPTIKRISRCLFSDMPTRWNWETTTTADNVLVESK